MKWLEFALEAGKLKRLRRTGWKRYGIKQPESVAEHSFRTALLAWVLAPELGVDRDRAVRMALVHDLGEAEIGDRVTHRWGKTLANSEAKALAERAAVRRIADLAGGDDLTRLFDEFEAGQTPEAQLVRQLDKLEMAIQAFEYEHNDGKDLREFYVTARTLMHDDKLVAILNELEDKRNVKG